MKIQIHRTVCKDQLYNISIVEFGSFSSNDNIPYAIYNDMEVFTDSEIKEIKKQYELVNYDQFGKFYFCKKDELEHYIENWLMPKLIMCLLVNKNPYVRWGKRRV